MPGMAPIAWMAALRGEGRPGLEEFGYNQSEVVGLFFDAAKVETASAMSATRAVAGSELLSRMSFVRRSSAGGSKTVTGVRFQ
jgi:hypothetical protein